VNIALPSAEAKSATPTASRVERTASGRWLEADRNALTTFSGYPVAAPMVNRTRSH
jgi:hypothetical protein